MSGVADSAFMLKTTLDSTSERAAKPSSVMQVPMRWPVISIGNLTMGGSGKTPVAREVLAELGYGASDIAALRAKQLRRGARPRLGEDVPAPHKAERVAMEEVKRGLVYYDVPPAKPVAEEAEG